MGAFKDFIKEEAKKYQQSIVEEVKAEITKQAKEGEKAAYLYYPNYEHRKVVTSFLSDEGFNYFDTSYDYIEVDLENL